jgi:uncharacterized protein (DUF2249 family)
MKKDSIEAKQIAQKESLLEQLKKTPIVQVCCDKVGISRATYYRWRNEDKEFKKLSELAIGEGCQLINDYAESQLISAIKEQNITAIFYWLNHRHPAYGNKVEISGSIKNEDVKLTPEQEENIRKALAMAASVGVTKEGEDEKDKTTI